MLVVNFNCRRVCLFGVIHYKGRIATTSTCNCCTLKASLMCVCVHACMASYTKIFSDNCLTFGVAWSQEGCLEFRMGCVINKMLQQQK